MQTYHPPTITDLGSLNDLTLGGTDGDRLDAGYPAGTLRGDLTFS